MSPCTRSGHCPGVSAAEALSPGGCSGLGSAIVSPWPRRTEMGPRGLPRAADRAVSSRGSAKPEPVGRRLTWQTSSGTGWLQHALHPVGSPAGLGATLPSAAKPWAGLCLARSQPSTDTAHGPQCRRALKGQRRWWAHASSPARGLGGLGGPAWAKSTCIVRHRVGSQCRVSTDVWKSPERADPMWPSTLLVPCPLPGCQNLRPSQVSL